MQLPRPEWSDHYLADLVGNPTETATAVAAVLLGGVIEELPLLRICFVHGGGSAPGLLGRWEHGWNTRADVRTHTKRSPREGFRELFFDSVTHDSDQLRLLGALAGAQRVVCGSDYPFDMAQQQPVRITAASTIRPRFSSPTDARSWATENDRSPLRGFDHHDVPVRPDHPSRAHRA